MDKVLETKFEEGILLVTINRPQAMNALNTQFFNELDELVASVKKDKAVNLVMIVGSGKAFVAGADIAEMVNKNQEEGKAFSRLGQNTFRSLEELDIPVIAVVNGFALGGGMELAMACDFRIVSSKAKFGQPEVNLGLIPGYAGTQRLSRLTNMGTALYLLMTADMITADEALRIGLVQKVAEPEVLMETSMTIAKNIISKGPQAIRKLKRVVRKGYEMSLDEGSELESAEFGSLFGDNSEGREGMSAFLEKRKPNW
ncbi:MAG: enoyl-CoA hydratase/isomerase family protein [Bacteroidales bacterium]|nr:enoyl-CoA hydratase/isomerase family protein [Bacteroidales bacterium]